MEQCRSGTGLVARNSEGVVIASKAVVHDNVGSAFAGEALTCLEAVKMGGTFARFQSIRFVHVKRF
ncbi:hypothetical protein Goari_023928 [Gossypium aridum]|uniref:RNase H type-1 domain-containing protein n=1 Tax=Gossypium aridum TaxID=34290 RepID=A0A7J8X4K0_GOSAI|nr:hypothetical protein [Gossypium aridum]